ncbi:cadherin-4-like [Arapaima gigas]
MRSGLVGALLVGALLMRASRGAFGDPAPQPPHRPGFSEGFYKLFVSRSTRPGRPPLTGTPAKRLERYGVQQRASDLHALEPHWVELEH